MKRITIAILLAVFTLFFGPYALSQGKFPDRPVDVIIPWPPGGGGMLNFQTLQPAFEKALGVTAVIVSKPGGAGTIGWNILANAPTNGYTLGIMNSSLIVTQYTTKTGVNYKKFDPIIMTVMIPLGVTVKSDSPWKTFKEFIDYAKANPGKINMGNAGHAASFHIGSIGIEKEKGVKFKHIPFKGTGPCVTALLGGHVDGALVEIATILPYMEAKKVRVLAVSSKKRNFALPDVPTFNENGFNLDVSVWIGYVAPKGTPKDRIKVLHDAFKVAVDSEAFRAFYAKQGGVIEYMGPEKMGSHLEELDKLWKGIINFAGFKPE